MLCVAEIIWCLGISYSSIDVVSDVVMVESPTSNNIWWWTNVTYICRLIWRRHHLEYWLTPHCGSQLAKHVTGVTPVPGRRSVWLVRRLIMLQGMRTCLTCGLFKDLRSLGLLVYSYT